MQPRMAYPVIKDPFEKELAECGDSQSVVVSSHRWCVMQHIPEKLSWNGTVLFLRTFHTSCFSLTPFSLV